MTDQSLSDLPLAGMERYQQRALLRLQVKLTGDVHQLLIDLADDLRAKVIEAAAVGEGDLSIERLFALQTFTGERWAVFFAEFQRIFGEARRQAATLPGALLLRWHNWYARQAKTALAEARPINIDVTGVFSQQIEVVLQAAEARIYSDGFNLSQRIWRLDKDSLQGLQDVLYRGIAGQRSAWDIAKDVEQYLGMGRDCPRWTRYRLYGKTKAQIAAGDRGGLYSGDECKGQGVAYNALRLARNEIQIAHHAASDALFARQPWVEQEQIVLSPDHPDIGCECEEVVVGGENGDGVYPKGTVTLPIHVQCLCNKLAVLMAAEAFAARMRGETAWPEMDEYTAWLGLPGMGLPVRQTGRADAANPLSPVVAVSVADLLVKWVWGGEEALAGLW